MQAVSIVGILEESYKRILMIEGAAEVKERGRGYVLSKNSTSHRFETAFLTIVKANAEMKAYKRESLAVHVNPGKEQLLSQ